MFPLYLSIIAFLFSIFTVVQYFNNSFGEKIGYATTVNNYYFQSCDLEYITEMQFEKDKVLLVRATNCKKES